MSIFSQQVEALQFQLRHIAGLDTLLDTEQFAHIDHEMIGMMLEQSARFSEEKLLALAATGDREGCCLEDGKVSLPGDTAAVYQEWCALGFPTLALPLEHDGMGFPASVQSAVQEISDGANLAFGMLCINQRCASQALLAAASEEQLGEWLPALAAGEIATTIVISESQAGSDVGRIRTRAEAADAGKWRLNGSKIWISYADHDATDNILHLVLARTPDAPPGTRGLSLFAVPKLIDGRSNGVNVLRLEEKMGLHASPTCVLELEAAEGVLIGNEHEGIRNLFTMMNAMRLAVAVQGAAVANAATLHAIEYARERPQGGRPDEAPIMISEHADVKRMLLEMTARSELLRALALRTAAYLDQAELAQSPEQEKDRRQLAELLLPVAKTLGAEWGFEVASQGIQVLGGYGYTNDYPLERMARDIRVASIYEGTSGIQALDFVKRKLLGDDLAGISLLLEEIDQSLAASSNGNPLHGPLSELLSLYRECLQKLVQLATEDRKQVEPGAYAMLRLTGLLVCAWNGLALLGAANADGSDYEKRLHAALSLFADGLVSEARSWAEKASVTGFNYHF